MRRLLSPIVLCALIACSANTDEMPVSDQAVAPADPSASASASASSPDPSGPSPEDDAAAPQEKPADAGPADAGPACKKHLSVVFSVAAGRSETEAHGNGCWTTIDADGGANHQFRKCSTSDYVVHNPTAPNYAFDDTNPTVPLSEQQNFLSQCSSGATGDGFEYMAYRAGAWRLMTAPHMKAYFAELYSTDQTIDDYYADWQTTLSGHTVSPMINIGPKNPSVIQSAALKMCNRVANDGYFGVYNGDWRNSMATNDSRAVALAKALNACTAL